MSDAATTPRQGWLGPGVAGIGTASFLADVGHEIPTALLPNLPTALLPNLLTATLGAPAAALGLIEGIADGLAARPGLPAWPSPTTHAGAAPKPSVATPPPPCSPA